LQRARAAVRGAHARGGDPGAHRVGIGVRGRQVLLPRVARGHAAWLGGGRSDLWTVPCRRIAPPVRDGRIGSPGGIVAADGQSEARRGQRSMIKLIRLSKNYGSFTAVDGVDLEVPRGELFAFLGPNGAGKTPTLRMIAGIL